MRCADLFRATLLTAAVLVGVAHADEQGSLTLATGRLILTVGRFAPGNIAMQTVEVENRTSQYIQDVRVECGFFHDQELVSSGVNFVENLAAGSKGFAPVYGQDAQGATSAQCRIVKFR